MYLQLADAEPVRTD